MTQVGVPLTRVIGAIRPHIDAFSFTHARYPATLVYIARCILQLSLTPADVIIPESKVEVSVCVMAYSDSLTQAFLIGALIDVTVDMLSTSGSVRFAESHLACIY